MTGVTVRLIRCRFTADGVVALLAKVAVLPALPPVGAAIDLSPDGVAEPLAVTAITLRPLGAGPGVIAPGVDVVLRTESASDTEAAWAAGWREMPCP